MDFLVIFDNFWRFKFGVSLIVLEILLKFSSWAFKMEFSKIHEELVDVFKRDLNTYSTCTDILIPQALLFERLVKYLHCQKSSQ